MKMPVVNHSGFIVTILLICAAAHGADFYVDPSYSGAGTGPNDPYQTLGAATTAANAAGGSHNIYIAAGTYADLANGGLEDFDGGGSNGISVTRKINFYGGYAGYEGGATFDWTTRAPRTSVVDLKGAGARAFDNNYGSHVYDGPLFDGLTFRNADHSGSGAALRSNAGYGTGVYINDCLFQNNTTTASGGAVYLNSSASDAWVRNSDFYSNSASNGGGLWWGPSFTATHEVTDSSFSGNTATGSGGAMYVSEGSNSGVAPRIERSRFTGNSAGAAGGALFSRNGIGVEPLAVYLSQFTGNSAPIGAVAGGSTYWHGEYYFENILAANNTGGYAFHAQGNRVRDDFALDFAHATIVNNPGGGIYARSDGLGLRVLNTILVDNGATGINYNQSGGPAATLDYNDVWNHVTGYAGDATAGANSISQDPMFWDESSGNYRLHDDSPILDLGTDLGIYADMDGKTRPIWGGYDMGAFENPEPAAGTLLVMGALILLCGRTRARS